MFRVLSSRSLMRLVSASGTCRLVTAAARGQDELSLLARGAGQGSSQLYEEGVRPFEFMTVGF